MVESRRVTLADVARRAGVSTTTASYVLNGRTEQMRIAVETERRVREAAAALGYRPNRSARNLRTASTKTIGLISDLLAGGQFASQMLTGASNAARDFDRLLVIGESGGDPEVERLLIEEMVDRQVDGIVYATVVTAEISAPEILGTVPSVLLNCVDPARALPAVLPDELEGGRTAVEAVLASGVEGGVWVVGVDPTPNALAGPLRLRGVRARLAEAGRTLDGVIACDWRVDAAYSAVAAFLAGGARPRALVCLNDRIGMGAFQALASHGLCVPRDVVVVAFDGSELARWLRPSLTSVAVPYGDLGAQAVLSLLGSGRGPAGVTRLPMPLTLGGSTPVPGGAAKGGTVTVACDAASHPSDGASR